MENRNNYAASYVIIPISVTIMMMTVVINSTSKSRKSPKQECEVRLQSHRYDGSYIYDIDTCDKAKMWEDNK